ncbi:PEP-CTERM sorting domain-containing protein [Rhodopirellula halodulae]|uniref:PEP-CTERM sorting domain-containing protein n=1 Tax=Rhodopirellula halodulae TaxID=2894198 RepID=UPI001E5B33B0|nr:PEP-CTERM sorting domain-containing protein [Rhodopirellula sp. JC737]MCC9655242.1 PEP-CTERM sorting domain-containing protein [Rhodopirellula sp. JC737]
MTGILMMLSSIANAAVIGGSSSSSFLSSDLEVSLLPILGGVSVSGDLTLGPSVSGSAPAAYSVEEEVLGIAADAGVESGVITTLGVSSSSVMTLASSTVDGSLGTKNAIGSQVIEDLDLSIGDLPVAADVLSITADTITVSSAVNGDFGSLSSSGMMNVANLQVLVNGTQVGLNLDGDLTLTGDIAPNTTVDLSSVLGGATLILNEQSLVGDGTSSLSLDTNAINLQLTNVGVTGVGELDGSVLVGSTNASLNASAVPEPSSLAVLGFASLGGIVWRRRRRPLNTSV